MSWGLQCKTSLNVITALPRKNHILENVTSPTSFLNSSTPEATKGLTLTWYPNTLTFTGCLQKLSCPLLNSPTQTSKTKTTAKPKTTQNQTTKQHEQTNQNKQNSTTNQNDTKKQHQPNNQSTKSAEEN